MSVVEELEQAVKTGPKVSKTGEHPMDNFLRMDRIPHIWCPSCGIGVTVNCFAQALEKNCLVLMGPTDARHTDSDTEKTIIIQKDLPCIPCHKKVCPLKHNKCMKDISPEEVLETIIKNKFL